MTRLRLRPYRAGDDPPRGSVPVSVVVLTQDEAPNIGRCLGSVAWADQVVVVDSGSRDDTITIAKSLGAEVVEQPWLGYSAQRDYALRLGQVRHDWVYFVDADEWVSPQLASEIAEQLRAPSCAAFSHRVRLVFQGTWIRHCGWYSAALFVQLLDRRCAAYDGEVVGERPRVTGSVGRLRNDLVDEDLKGLAAWLHKHVRYAQLQAGRRGRQVPVPRRLRELRDRNRAGRPLVRVLLKDVIFPALPAKPVALFGYMYLLRLGFLDGRAGLRFCFYHAWYEASIAALQAEAVATGRAQAAERAAEREVPVETRMARRAAGDILAVCQCARPAAAARWTAALATRFPECVRHRSLRPADRSWMRSGARFRTATGAVVSLPGSYSPGAREMYCRNVYLRSGLTMPTDGWVMDLGANRGLFSVWAARTGAQAVAVEAQHGYAAEIRRLAAHNRVADYVHVETAIVGGACVSGASVGVVADDHRWATTSHGAPTRPADTSVPQLMAAHGIQKVGLLKIDIEGSEFAVLGEAEDLGWLDHVDQLVLEVHRDFGDPVALTGRLREAGFSVDLRDNDGGRVAASSARLSYAYCRR